MEHRDLVVVDERGDFQIKRWTCIRTLAGRKFYRLVEMSHQEARAEIAEALCEQANSDIGRINEELDRALGRIDEELSK